MCLVWLTSWFSERIHFFSTGEQLCLKSSGKVLSGQCSFMVVPLHDLLHWCLNLLDLISERAFQRIHILIHIEYFPYANHCLSPWGLWKIRQQYYIKWEMLHWQYFFSKTTKQKRFLETFESGYFTPSIDLNFLLENSEPLLVLRIFSYYHSLTFTTRDQSPKRHLTDFRQIQI